MCWWLKLNAKRCFKRFFLTHIMHEISELLFFFNRVEGSWIMNQKKFGQMLTLTIIADVALLCQIFSVILCKNFTSSHQMDDAQILYGDRLQYFKTYSEEKKWWGFWNLSDFWNKMSTKVKQISKNKSRPISMKCGTQNEWGSREILVQKLIRKAVPNQSKMIKKQFWTSSGQFSEPVFLCAKYRWNCKNLLKNTIYIFRRTK